MAYIALRRLARNFNGQRTIDCSMCVQITGFLFIANVDWQASKLDAFFMGHPVYDIKTYIKQVSKNCQVWVHYKHIMIAVSTLSLAFN